MGRVHISWFIAYCCLGFVLGVAIAPSFIIGWAWLLITLPLVALFVLKKTKISAILGFIFVFILGVLYGGYYAGKGDGYLKYIGSERMFVGNIREDPSFSSGGQCIFQLNDVKVEQENLTGAILVTAPCLKIKRGDVVTFRGKLGEGFGSFMASSYRASVVEFVRPSPGDIGGRVRDWFAVNVRQAIPDPQASLGIGFLTGQKNAMPEELSEAMRVVGLTHIVVASGYNLTILVRMCRRLFIRLSKYVSLVSSCMMIISFMSVTGLSPSMARAGLVSGSSLMAWYFGGVFHPFVLICIAAAVTVVLQPYYVWGDMGWQLSFAAFAGVMFVAPLLQRYFFGVKDPGVIRQILGETIAAHLVTIPIIAIGFGAVSNVAILANLLVVPLVPLAMLLTFVIGILVICSVPLWLVEIVSVPTGWLLTYMTEVARFLANFEWSQSEINLAPIYWLLYYLALVACTYWMHRATKLDLRDHNLIM